MKLTHWRLAHPERLAIHPTSAVDQNALPHYELCVVGQLPNWLSDFLSVMSINSHIHIPVVEETLPCSADWILLSGSEDVHFEHPRILRIADGSGVAKKQLWQQVCQYE